MRIACTVPCLLASAYALPGGQTPPARAAGVTVFDGARLILGDGKSVIEDGVLVARDGKLSAVGQRSNVAVPPNAARVSLSGKTVMPVLVDLHSHVGFSKEGVFEPEHYTRENIVDQLRRLEYYGVGAILSLGTDPGVTVFQLRDDQRAGKLDTLRLYVAGRGFVAPGGGPPVHPLEHVPLEVEHPALARIFVRELAAMRVDMIKLWVDDRRGTKPKLAPDVYRAIIDEAHKNNVRVMAHVFYLDDAKALLRAGVDGFAHMIRDREVDDEFVRLARERNAFICGAAGIQAISPRDWLNDPALAETVAPATIARLKSALGNTASSSPPSDVARILLGNIKKLHDEGVTVVFGTDTVTPGKFYGLNQHLELAALVAAGLTPLQAIEIATARSAEVLRSSELGGLQPGKSADFIVLDGNPLEDISNTKKISAVYRRGRALDRAAMRMAWTKPSS